MSSQCVRSFTIPESVGDCPDWATLLWGPATLFGTASFTPNNIPGDAFTLSIDDQIAQAFNSATIDYNGTGCDCHLHLTITGNTLAENPVCTISIHQVSPFLNLLCVGGAGPLSVGTYDITFSLPDTLGATLTYEIDIGITHAAPSYFISLAGTFANT